jgi:hypothetical protein
MDAGHLKTMHKSLMTGNQYQCISKTVSDLHINKEMLEMPAND